MVHGAPDYGIYAIRTAPIVGLADLGEAVARMGAINIWDRRGFTILQDDFESPVLRWLASNVAPGDKPVLSSSEVRMGSQSCLLNAPPGAGSESYITKILPLLRKGRLGFEIWVQARAYIDGYFYWKLWQKDGSNIAYAEFRLDTVANNIKIRTPDGYEEVLTDVYSTEAKHFFLPIKIVIDTNTDKYVRLLVSSHEVDLSAYSLLDMGDTTDRKLEIRYGCLGCALANFYAYVDNFIFTQDEP